jgi:hypothetical protein
MNYWAFIFWLLCPAMCFSQTCTDTDKFVVCGTKYCNFPVETRGSCTLKWASTALDVPFLCTTNKVTGACEQCPAGWTAEGAFCVECPNFKSCDVLGAVVCNGACAAGFSPTCDPSGFVSCISCPYNQSLLSAQRRRLTRGGIIDTPEKCDAYFECDAGYYLSLDSSGQLTCQTCQVPEPSLTGWEFFSNGLTFGDAFSCIYRSKPAFTGTNEQGQFGNFSQSCPLFYTSERFMAPSQSDCVPCPFPPTFGGFHQGFFDCRPVCDDGYSLLGNECVPVEKSLLDCDADGYVKGVAMCTSMPLPWAPVDTYVTGEPLYAVQARGEVWTAVDQTGDFRVRSGAPKQLWRAGASNHFCSSGVSNVQNQAYVQDLPLFTKICLETEQHTFYFLLKSSKYLYAFLERSFGNNNRFVLWQVSIFAQNDNSAGTVYQTWRLPAKVCSAVVVPVNASSDDMLYFSFCNATFVSFLQAKDYSQTFGSVSDIQITGSNTKYFLNRKTNILIGRDEPGKADGMRDQALFRGPLTLANTADPSRLLLADRDNCRIVELVVGVPGSFTVRATTIGNSGCFSGDFPLPFPRMLTPVLGGKFFLFITDSGLVQVDFTLRSFQFVVKTGPLARIIGSVQWIFASDDGLSLTLHNSTHSATLTAPHAPCPALSVSRIGGSCQTCPEDGYYVKNGDCNPCSNLTCPTGSYVVPCNGTSDASCSLCPAVSPGFAFRFDINCLVVPQYPCPKDYYGIQPGDCLPCGLNFKLELPWYGVCQCLGYNLTNAGTSCDVPSPFSGVIGPFPVPQWVSAMGCRYDLTSDANCSEVSCYLARVYPRLCVPCPDGTYSVAGLYCQACSGFRTPNPSRDACVCKSPAYLHWDGVSCVCPEGHAAGGLSGCSPCPAGEVKPAPQVLPENYQAFSQGACTPCPAGQEPMAGSTVCRTCQDGKYREYGMASCEKCHSTLPFFAQDPAMKSTCTPCSSSCPVGYRWNPCPVNANLFACQPCEALFSSRIWVAFPGSTNKDCLWVCRPGFYEKNSNCWACTERSCEPGFQLTACSKFEDSHCRVPCVNSTMPQEHSVWTTGCAWECKSGYKRVKKEFAGWSEYACEPTTALPWSIFW